MPYVNFHETPDADDYSPIPPGQYICHVKHIEEGQTEKGHEMWTLYLEVEDGKYASRVVFDRLIFSPKAIKRIKLVCSRLGIDKDFSGELRPEMLLGKRAMISVELGEYDGKPTNNVPFSGYESLDQQKPLEKEEDIPF